jgi:hypothetical protein
VPSHQRLGPDGLAALVDVVASTMPGLSQVQHAEVVMRLANVVAPLVAAAYEHELSQMQRHAAARRLEDQRQEERVRVLREALRWYEHLEGSGGRATRALNAARWQPPLR